MGFKTFEEMEVWQNARRLTRVVSVYAKRARDKRDWSWADQIMRSSLSVMANIAEGHDALTNLEFSIFLGYAKRSSAETRSHLYCGLDEGYLSSEEFEEAASIAKLVGAQIAKLIRHLRKNPLPITHENDKLTSRKLQANKLTS